MKKLAIIILAISLLIPAGTAVFAEEAQGPSAKDPVPQEVKDKYSELKALKEDSRLLAEELRSIIAPGREEMNGLKEKIRTHKNGDFSSLKGKLQVLREENRPFKESVKNIQKLLRQARADKDSEKTEDLRKQLADIKASLEGSKSEFEALKEKLADEREFLKGLKEELENYKGQFAPYKEEIRALLGQLRSQKQAMREYAAQLKNARNDGDMETVSLVLDDMIALQKEINTALESLLKLKSD